MTITFDNPPKNGPWKFYPAKRRARRKAGTPCSQTSRTGFVLQGKWQDPQRPGWFDMSPFMRNCGMFETLKEALEYNSAAKEYHRTHPKEGASILAEMRILKRTVIDECVGGESYTANAHDLAEERSDDSQQRVVGTLNQEDRHEG